MELASTVDKTPFKTQLASTVSKTPCKTQLPSTVDITPTKLTPTKQQINNSTE